MVELNFNLEIGGDFCVMKPETCSEVLCSVLYPSYVLRISCLSDLFP